MKKAQIQADIPFFIAIIFLMAIIGIIAFFTISKISDSFGSSADIPTEAKDMLSSSATRTKNVNDWIILTLVVGLFIAIIITAMILRASPAFAGIAILLMLIMVGIAIHFSNAFYGFTSSADIQPYSSQFNVTTTIMAALPKFIVFLIAVYIIILYSKGGSSGSF